MLVDITGRKYGRLTVLHKTEPKHEAMRWLCLCECGNIKEIYGKYLKNGRTKSCGCLIYEPKVEKPRNAERLYQTWKKMRGRCRGDSESGRKYYLSRDIKVCSEWNDYLVFKTWALANGYKDNLTIDRIDNNKGYSPENCRWITQFEQASNTSKNRWITINGYTKTLAQWARVLNLFPSSVHKGLSRNGISYIEKRLNCVSGRLETNKLGGI